jgi:hypothetical protein
VTATPAQGSLARGDARRTEGITLVAVHVLPGQRLPLRITAARPLSVVACEALPAADRLLAHSGAGLGVRQPGADVLTRETAAAALAHGMASQVGVQE